MNNVIEKLDKLILPFLKLIDIGNLNNSATKKWQHGKHEFVEELLKTQWTDGPPKDTGKSRFVLVLQPKEHEEGYYEELWDATIDRLTDHSGVDLPVIKHIELPDYE